jgi:uncharacterized protein (DUF433 family)
MSQDSTKSAIALDAHIEITPGTCGGKPRIAGHRIRVQDIVVWHDRMGQSADEIVSDFPQLSLADVYAALAYYHDHRAEIDSQMEADEKLVEEMRRFYPSKLKAKLAGKNDGPDSLSSR